MAKRAMKKPIKKRPVGRPKFEVNDATRKRVERLLGCGISQKAIAAQIGCDAHTLVKHFKDELLHGVDRARAEIIESLYESADDGNVSAQRKLYSILHGDPDVAKFTPVTTDAGSAKVKDDKKLGKKELLQQEAAQHDDTFSAPQPPKLVVDNRK